MPQEMNQHEGIGEQPQAIRGMSVEEGLRQEAVETGKRESHNILEDAASAGEKSWFDLKCASVRDWWNPFPEVTPLDQWPVRLVNSTDWVAERFVVGVKDSIQRKSEIEGGIAFVFSIAVSLFTALGYVASGLAVDRFGEVIVVALVAIAVGLISLLFAIFCTTRAWHGHAYAYSTTALHQVEQLTLLKEEYERQGFDRDTAATYAHEELRDRVVVRDAYSYEVNHTVNNRRGVWLHRARTCLLVSVIPTLVAISAHLIDIQNHKFNGVTMSDQEKESQRSQATANQTTQSKSPEQQKPAGPRPPANVPPPPVEIRKDGDGAKKK